MDRPGLIALLVVLVAGLILGWWHRRTSGRLRDVAPAAGSALVTTLAESGDGRVETGQAGGGRAGTGQAGGGRAGTGQAGGGRAGTGRSVVEAGVAGSVRPVVDPTLLADLGVGPAQATLLQFSTAFCAPCRAVRRVSAEVAGLIPGVQHVEVDAESHLDAVRALGIWRTPTLLILDADGRVTKRATGVPTKPHLIAALGEIL